MAAATTALSAVLETPETNIPAYHWSTISCILSSPILPHRKAESIYTLLRLEHQPRAPHDLAKNTRYAVLIARIVKEASATNNALLQTVDHAATGTSYNLEHKSTH